MIEPTNDSDFILAFAYLVSLVRYYAPKDDVTVQAFLPKAEGMARELLHNEKSSKDGRESSGDREGATGCGGNG